MAKKSMLEREKKREKMVAKYAKLRGSSIYSASS